jgi:hypothetical protein
MASAPVRVEIRPPVRWNPVANRYIDVLGRFIGELTVRTIVDADVERAMVRVDKLFDAAGRELLTVEQWRDAMAEQIVNGHLAHGAAARGGVKHMAKADYEYLQERAAFELEHLDQFAAKMAGDPAYRESKAARRRARSYVDSFRTTYEAARFRYMMESGAKWARRLLHSTESCAGCVALKNKGWMAIADMPPIGSQKCQVSCRCTIIYNFDDVMPAN